MGEFELHPTLWRTCRVLASRRRLAVLRHLCRDGPATVGDVQDALGLSSSAASQALRQLGARGLLRAARKSRFVEYRVQADPAVGDAVALVPLLRKQLRRRRDPSLKMIHTLTAFTHPRRILLAAALAAGARSEQDLIGATSISRPALRRHLRKLAARGFARRVRGVWRPRCRSDPLSRELLALARRHAPLPSAR